MLNVEGNEEWMRERDGEWVIQLETLIGGCTRVVRAPNETLPSSPFCTNPPCLFAQLSHTIHCCISSLNSPLSLLYTTFPLHTQPILYIFLPHTFSRHPQCTILVYLAHYFSLPLSICSRQMQPGSQATSRALWDFQPLWRCSQPTSYPPPSSPVAPTHYPMSRDLNKGKSSGEWTRKQYAVVM